MVGGVAAFVGAKMLGPRIGKYDKNGKPKAILGHSLTLAALGVFIPVSYTHLVATIVCSGSQSRSAESAFFAPAVSVRSRI